MMDVSAEQAAEIYAKCMRAWYGSRAEKLASQRINELQAARDQEGIYSWSLVLQNLREFEKKPPHSNELH